jgi:hypothetical protein
MIQEQWLPFLSIFTIRPSFPFAIRMLASIGDARMRVAFVA